MIQMKIKIASLTFIDAGRELDSDQNILYMISNRKITIVVLLYSFTNEKLEVIRQLVWDRLLEMLLQ